MNTFQQRTANRIAAVSFLLAVFASPIAWYVSRENAEEGIVSLAIEESGRLLHHFDSMDLTGPQGKEHASAAVKAIVGGMFDIAEIYDPKGSKLAESLTKEGRGVEASLIKHGAPAYSEASYKSVKLAGNVWVL
jgi:hypothetical protein